jgi:DNA (cytosine-5)-methyltransferase 1
MRVLDLFSGIGGFHLGLERAGFEIESYFSEIDKYAIQVYQNNFKEAKYVGSITDVKQSNLPRIDAITFGSPCQDFSLAGKRKGLDGSRSSLITEAIRLIDECRPSFFIWENVKGTFSSNNREDFAAILQAFANIGGYRLEWQLLNTKWFLPQNRERIYLVGYLGDGSRGQVFPIRESIDTDYTSREKGDTSSCLTATYGRGVAGGRQHIEVVSATSKGYEEAKPGDSINLSVPTSKTRRGRVDKGVAQTLDTQCNQAVIYDGYNGQIKDEDITGTITQHCSRDGLTNGFKVIRENKIRRLTPIECERLQGFPDNWTKFGTKGEISDSQRYKMCGNAVTVDVVKAVAERIKLVI